jgi:hypothetical protein
LADVPGSNHATEKGSDERARLRFTAMVLALLSAGKMATPGEIPEAPPEIQRPHATFTFAGVIYNNPPAWTCHRQIVNLCLICTNTSGDVTALRVMSLAMSGYE